jgi:transposase
MSKKPKACHVATISSKHKGKVYKTVLLRRTYRDQGKVKHETLGNLTDLPDDLIDVIKRRLKTGIPLESEGWEIIRSLPHGAVAAVLGVLHQLGLDNIIGSQDDRTRRLIIGMIVSRVVSPGSKLNTARCLKRETATSSLGELLDIDDLDDRELYQAMDWLLKRQVFIEKSLAKKHLSDSTLILYDVSSSYYTGTKPPLVSFGHNRDGKKDHPRIVYGLICNDEGCPISIEVFEGKTADSKTLGPQIEKIRERFGIKRIVIVADRGLITTNSIERLRKTDPDLEWIGALRSQSIKKLMKQGEIHLSLFDEKDLAEIESEDYPGERLIVCRNPLLADKRAKTRESLLTSTEKDLNKIVDRTKKRTNPLRGGNQISLEIGKVINKHNVGKHFKYEIQDDSFTFERDVEKIEEEARLDGIYVIRTSIKSEEMKSEQVVGAYKRLSQVEKAFRSLKTIDLKVRPIFHWTDDRIRAHVFLCMLAYYVEWHMIRKLAPILFDDHCRAEAEESRESIVRPAPRSDEAKAKEKTKRTEDGAPVHSFRTLLQDLGTLAMNKIRINANDSSLLTMNTVATDLQKKVFDLLGVTP